MEFSITDDNGFIALINAEKYNGFIDENWSLNQICERFINEMNNQNLIIWRTNNFGGGNWKIEILDNPSNKKVFRKFEKTINVTSEELYLTEYTDLSMVAQFDDEKIPSKHNSHLKFKIENGIHNIEVRQMFDQNLYGENNDVDFEVVIKKVGGNVSTQTEGIYWW